MQRQETTPDAFGVQLLKHLIRKVQTRRRSGYGALLPGVHGLVGLLVAFFSIPLKVGRQGYLAQRLHDFQERQVCVPLQPHAVVLVVGVGRFELYCLSGYGEGSSERFGRLPSFLVPNHALPHAFMAYQHGIVDDAGRFLRVQQ